MYVCEMYEVILPAVLARILCMCVVCDQHCPDCVLRHHDREWEVSWLCCLIKTRLFKFKVAPVTSLDLNRSVELTEVSEGFGSMKVQWWRARRVVVFPAESNNVYCKLVAGIQIVSMFLVRCVRNSE